MTGRVEEVSFSAPKFEDDVSLWFRQAEAKFEVSRITSQKTKFNLAFGNLPASILKPVLHLVPDPKDDPEPYDRLKEIILGKVTLTQNQRIENILRDMDIGDRKPSTYYQELLETAGQTIPQDTVYRIWLSRIPVNVKVAMIAFKSDDFNERMEMADDVMAACVAESAGRIAEVSKDDDPLSAMRKQIDDLFKLVKDNRRSRSRSPSRQSSRKSNNYSKGQNRSNSRARSTSRSQVLNDKEICWYHENFKNDARKCIPGCKFSSKN